MLRREEKRQVAGKMKEMAKLNVPEREFLESRTGCRIGSPGGECVDELAQTSRWILWNCY